MSVSVIMPAYNAAKYLAEAIESVRAQTRPDWELTVVNDGSCDETASIAEAFARRDARIHVLHQANGGISRARNRGLSDADSSFEYVAFLDHDDLWDPDCLEVLIGALERQPGAVGAHGLRRDVDSESRLLRGNGSEVWPAARWGVDGNRIVRLPPTAPTTFAMLAFRNVISVAGVVLRRGALEAAGGFDPEATMAEDWDLWLRVTLRGDFAFVNRVVYSYRCHDTNMSRDRRRRRGFEDAVRRRIYVFPELTDEQRRVIVIGYRFHELYSCRERLRLAKRTLQRGGFSGAARKVGQAARHFSRFLGGTP